MGLEHDLTQHVKDHGVDFVGVTTVAPFYVGEERRLVEPRDIMPEARSLIVTGFYTYTAEPCVPSEPGTPRGRFGPWTRLSMPAIRHQTEVMLAFLRERGLRAEAAGGLPAKPAAVRAGWATYGKNSIVHAPGAGSYVKIQMFLTDAELDAAEHPIETSDCGDCDECIKACPTGALARPYMLDWDRCVCAWLWGRPIPRPLRHAVGNHLHRCSYCQDACPLNQDLTPRESVPFALDGPTPTPELIPLLLADDETLKKSLPGFVYSAGADAIRRNVAVALGNVGDPAAVGPLARALREGAPQVRASAAWALGRIGSAAGQEALSDALAREEDVEVKTEIEAALAEA